MGVEVAITTTAATTLLLMSAAADVVVRTVEVVSRVHRVWKSGRGRTTYKIGSQFLTHKIKFMKWQSFEKSPRYSVSDLIGVKRRTICLECAFPFWTIF